MNRALIKAWGNKFPFVLYVSMNTHDLHPIANSKNREVKNASKSKSRTTTINRARAMDRGQGSVVRIPPQDCRTQLTTHS